MKYHFGNGSERKLLELDNDGVRVLRYALSMGLIDIAVVQTARSKAEQDRYFEIGKSQVRWPKSKHNRLSTADKVLAFDAAPYVNGKVSWKKEHCIFLAGIIQSAAKSLGVIIRWGGNWDMDGEPITDQNFQDLVHYEVIK